MDRDVKNEECTRDPIFLLQSGAHVFNWVTDDIAMYGDVMCVEKGKGPQWIQPFIVDGCVEQSKAFWQAAKNQESEDGVPMVYTRWITESVFLTRKEAEDWATAHSYRYELWRVYCVPCEGKLASLLNEYSEPDLLEQLRLTIERHYKKPDREDRSLDWNLGVNHAFKFVLDEIKNLRCWDPL